MCSLDCFLSFFSDAGCIIGAKYGLRSFPTVFLDVTTCGMMMETAPKGSELQKIPPQGFQPQCSGASQTVTLYSSVRAEGCESPPTHTHTYTPFFSPVKGTRSSLSWCSRASFSRCCIRASRSNGPVGLFFVWSRCRRPAGSMAFWENRR